MRSLRATLALALVAGCASPASPDDVPLESVVDEGLLRVLQVTFRATDSGYTLVHVRHTLGTPTLGFDPDREVLVTARDARGQPIVALAVPNPRTVTCLGPVATTRAEAFLNLRFPEPVSIRSLEAVVRGGPNEGLRQVFAID
jgi:hypothetical protein